VSLSTNALSLHDGDCSFSSGKACSLMEESKRPCSITTTKSPPASAGLSTTGKAVTEASQFIRPGKLPFPAIRPRNIAS
ncbi:hypothetical protein OSL60_29065, partial [Escherichia coli]|nr:hypothetical protein [Escherichia coli]